MIWVSILRKKMSSCFCIDLFLSVDTSATESENETKALGIDPITGKKVRGKKKKDRDKLLKDKQNKKLNNKKLKKDRKDKLKMKQTKLQLQKAKNKLLPGKRTFQKRVRGMNLIYLFLSILGRLRICIQCGNRVENLTRNNNLLFCTGKTCVVLFFSIWLLCLLVSIHAQNMLSFVM